MSRALRLAALVTATLASALVASPAQAADSTTLLRLGYRDGNQAHPESVDAEFEQVGFSDSVTYDAGILPLIDREPAIPSSLDIDADSCNDKGCARVLHIRFTLPEQFDGSTVVLGYSRAGSELDTIRVDGSTVANIAGREGAISFSRVVLGDLEAGEHTLSFQYNEYRRANGHYIDSISLVTLD